MTHLDPPDRPAHVVHVTDVRARAGSWLISARCPGCFALVSHGGGLVADGPPTLGHRVAHRRAGTAAPSSRRGCTCGVLGYDLVDERVPAPATSSPRPAVPVPA